jgi:hypothetical protein
MTAKPPCPQNTQVDAYFAGRLSPSRQGGLRAHLDGCDDCRGRFGRHQRLAALDPAALPFEERIGRALGLRTGGSVARWLGRPALIGVLAVGMVLLVGRSFLPGWSPGGFAARGPDEPRALILSTPGVEVLAFRTDQPAATLQTGQLPGAAELAFAYRNRGGWPFLMVFARDEIGNVYWYQPSWTDGRADPQAVALSADPGLHELPQAVSHVFKGRRLTLCAVASDRPLSVRQLEQQLPAAGSIPLAEQLASAGREIACRQLEVLP